VELISQSFKGGALRAPPFFYSHSIFFIMPKIQLSALASDIKGKSNGSVFSKNSGGTYFRNAPSGGPRKTQRLQDQKTLFGSLATQWRALTNSQQDAWNAAAPNYPTKNAFGAPRIPTGYELYMRLNANLLAAGQPQLVLPQEARSIEIPTSNFIDSPDLYMFTPQQCINLGAQGFPRLFLLAKDCFVNENFSAPVMFSAHYGGSSTGSNFPSQGVFVTLMYNELSLGDKWALVLTRNNANQKIAILSVVYRFSVTSRQTQRFEFVLPEDFDHNDFHMSLLLQVTAVVQPFLIINGEQIFVESSITLSGIQNVFSFPLGGTPVATENALSWNAKNGSWFVGCPNDDAPLRYRVSDIRFFNAVDLQLLADEDSSVFSSLRLVALGYVTTYETALIGAQTVELGFTKNFANTGDVFDMRIGLDPECTSNADCFDLGTGNDVECLDGVCTYVGDGPLVTSPAPFVYVPEVVFVTSGVTDPGFLFNVQCAGQRSPGRSNRQVKYTNTIFVDAVNESWLLTNELRRVYGSFSGGGDLMFRVSPLDGITGLSYDTLLPLGPGKGVRRFKAGAELSGKVN
jgi:hypothetical protein